MLTGTTPPLSQYYHMRMLGVLSIGPIKNTLAAIETEGVFFRVLRLFLGLFNHVDAPTSLERGFAVHAPILVRAFYLNLKPR